MDITLFAWIPLTVAALVASTVVGVKLVYLRRNWRLWLALATSFILAVAFGLLAISPHSSGIVQRTELAAYIRWLVFVGGVLACVYVSTCSGLVIQRKGRGQ